MSDSLIHIFSAAAIVAILVTLVEGLFGAKCRGVPSIVVGGILLLVGALFANVDPDWAIATVPTVQSIDDVHFMRDIVGFFSGVLFVACGVISRYLTGAARDQIDRLAEAINKAESEIKSAQELLSSVVRSSISGVMILHAIRDDSDVIVDFEVRLMNHEAEQILGRSSGTLMGQPLLKRIPCLKTQGYFQDAVSVIETKLPFQDERRCRQSDRDRWYQVAIVRHGDGAVATFADVSDRKRTEEQLRHAAEHDTLTGLPSRSLLSDRLEQAINRARRVSDYKFAVLFLDFDRFKIINDSLGHEVGDQLLISISERLRINLRDIDTPVRLGEGHLPARLGGDEFVVLLDGIQDARDAVIVAERLQQALAEPHQLDGHEVISTASIGIVTSDGNYERPDDILRDADTAMYQAKSSGKARHVVFDERMHSEVMQRLTLEKELRLAAEELRFTLAYQPIVSMQTGALAGFEALIRWPHSERGTVLPADFIALAEELGLMVPIGEWVIREACGRLAEWRKQFKGPAPLTMSVNLSKDQVVHRDLVPRIRQIVKKTGIPPSSLVLEITEGTIMSNLDELQPILVRLHEESVRLAMDDFGTGHSSLGFLHKAPIDLIKVDRSFVSNAGNARGFGAIIQTVVQLAHNLNMEVVAEGIESEDQLATVQSLGCNYGQGFLFSKPVPAEEAGKFLDPGHRFKVNVADADAEPPAPAPREEAA